MAQIDIRKKVDVLFENIEEYRTSEYFMNLLEFCSKFKMLAPYNAMLVRFQMPGARYVLSSSEWRDLYHRAINTDARPLVILFPFGPVNFVFDIQETHPLPYGRQYTDAEILEELERPYRTTGILDKAFLDNFIHNMPYHSIAFNPCLNAGSELGAKLTLLKIPYEQINVEISRQIRPISWEADYVLSTSYKGDDGQTFASIAHELGHLFCRHIAAPATWNVKKGNKEEPAWNVRRISHEAQEFEAETVSWLICDKVNLITPSEKYLSNFVNGKIPEGVSIDAIFTAFNKVWDMCSREYYPYQEGLLYKHCKAFQAVAEKYKNTKIN